MHFTQGPLIKLHLWMSLTVTKSDMGAGVGLIKRDVRSLSIFLEILHVILDNISDVILTGGRRRCDMWGLKR